MGIFRGETAREQRSDRSAGDRASHRAKVKQAIKENIHEIISEESIIGKDKNRIIKVPMRGIKEYRFVYGDNQTGVGTGDGNSEPGQVVGKARGKDQKGNDKAGDRPGQDYYETDITLEELLEIMYEDLELPDMAKKALKQIVAETKTKNVGVKRKGPRVHLVLRRTAIEHVRRLKKAERGIIDLEEQLASVKIFGKKEVADKLEEQLAELYKWKSMLEHPEEYEKYLTEHPEERARFPFHKDDLRFRRRKEKPRYESNAVIIFVMDTSGSMDTIKKYLARTFFFLLYQFISTKYNNVEIVFIAHHTEAQEVTENEFFHKGESGGTFISSGIYKALEVIARDYHPSLWNIYPFHCSDGDNFDSDNEAALKAARELCEIANLFGYVEIKPDHTASHESSMFSVFKRLSAPNFQTVLIKDKKDIWPSFRALLTKDKEGIAGLLKGGE